MDHTKIAMKPYVEPPPSRPRSEEVSSPFQISLVPSRRTFETCTLLRLKSVFDADLALVVRVRCRANMARTSQRPDPGLGFLVKVLKIFSVFPALLGSGLRTRFRCQEKRELARDVYC